MNFVKPDIFPQVSAYGTVWLKSKTISNNEMFFCKSFASFRGCQSILHIAILKSTGINNWVKLPDWVTELY